ncbi:MAG TPA: UDP-N-acetylmuramoyl-L-alanyl-D-glutamate--2,6-diaminopimelate ligase [Actinomycetes bacterium]
MPVPAPDPGQAPHPPRPAVPATPLAELAESLAGAAVAGDAQRVAVTGVTLDSRDVRPGDLYAALPGSRAHGADFAGQAAARGAAAVLTDPDGARRCTTAEVALPLLVVDDPRSALGALAAVVYGQPAHRLTVLGVTGTNGKTTTAYLLDAGLRAAGHRTGLVGTVETRVGDDVLPSVRTTPEAPDVQALLALMVERGCTAAALEVSSHALALGRVDGLVFDVAGFTNLSQDHLDFHGDLEDYFRAKASLFTPKRCRRAVVCVDGDHGRRLAAEATVPVTTVTCADVPGADWRAEDVVHDPDGSTRFRAVGPAGPVEVTTGLPGAFNVANALLALAMLDAVGVSVAAAASALAGVAVPGRMERVRAGQPFSAVVDYAHTPDAVSRAIEALRPAVTGRLLVVLGCGGDRDRAKRPLMGEVAARGADLLVVTDDNPRSEEPARIRTAVLEGAMQVPDAERAEVLEVGDRRAAIEAAVGSARAGDAVLVLGKGHEPGQELADRVLPFDDRAVLREAIAGVVA